MPEKNAIPAEQPNPGDLASAAVPLPAKATVKSQALSLNDPMFRDGLIMTAIVIVFWIVVLYMWLLAHGVHSEQFLRPTPEFLDSVAKFDFLGKTAENPEPSILSLNVEIVMWTILGVVIRTIYTINITIRQRKFFFLPQMLKWLGDMLMAAGISEAVILFLSITSFSIGTLDVTLAKANYKTIAAIAFILGFYHNDARRWLGSFRKKLLGINPASPSEGEKTGGS